jgi:Fe-S cluster assembly scaffold protein SufB
MTRGIEYKEALKLMVKARFNEIIDRIIDEELKNRVLEEIDRRLD